MMSSLDKMEFAMNQEPRCACVLLLDTSGSMAGAPIDALNAALVDFQETLASDSLARLRAEIAIVTFDVVAHVAQDFVTADDFRAPTLVARGTTAMGEGITKAIALIDARKATYKANGIDYYRPWLFLITDGAPTDDIESARKLLRAAAGESKLAFFAVGVAGADMGVLRSLAVGYEPVQLSGLKFQEMFVWLSSSLRKVSQSKVGDQTPLAPPSTWTV